MVDPEQVFNMFVKEDADLAKKLSSDMLGHSIASCTSAVVMLMVFLSMDSRDPKFILGQLHERAVNAIDALKNENQLNQK